jgi:hypothetical protein
MFRTLMIGLCLVAFAALDARRRYQPLGGWDVEAQRLQDHPMAICRLRSYEKLVVTTDKPEAVKWMLTGASADGKTYISMYDGPVDGKDRPYRKQPGG